MRLLRARLLAAVLARTAAGLLLLGGITYVGQRSYLLDRLDEQLRGSPPAAARALGGDGRFDRGPGERDRPPPPGGAPGSGLPVGTYVARLDADGEVVDDQVFTYGRAVTADPELPTRIPTGAPFTAGGSDTSYRVYAEEDRFGAGTLLVAAPLREIDATLDRLLALSALVIAGILVVLGLVAWAVVRVGLLPLDRIGHTAGAIAGGELSHRVDSTDPRTEVGRLGIALNAMLDRLEEAFGQRAASEERLRRFLADASHELRTPLASIRGYAELFRMGAARSDEDVATAMRRIEDEAARMGVLVEDLLTLAPDREISLDAGTPAIVLGDAHQLRQVLGNLLRNALVHTPAGTPIDVRVTGGDGVRLEVRDHGPGLPGDDPGALFERFWRAEGGRERGRAGAGLGLAIVAAIVDAHDGRVSAANADGSGAVFSVALPAAPGA
jgi:two-component system OmpR family sensor kinase